jgi:NAD(P)-dependent dehydrogenase (short-subunit alcohol dehydrogenase family)
MKLENRVAIVTGSGQGIGRATAVALAKEGAKVILNARTKTTLEMAAAEIDGLGGESVAVAGDISRRAVVQAVVEAALANYGQIDILVNNAGSGRTPDGQYRSYEEIREDDWFYIMEQNVKSVHLCCQLAIPEMKKRGRGSIVNVSSVAGRTCEPGQSNQKLLAPIEATYVSSKAAVQGLTRQLARDLGQFGIRVNAVAPGVILSSERLKRFWKSKTETERARVVDLIPLQRPGTAEEVANAILFLASEAASYITGATIDVNGGIFMTP